MTILNIISNVKSQFGRQPTRSVCVREREGDVCVFKRKMYFGKKHPGVCNDY